MGAGICAQGAALISGTGYQYGDADLTEYAERLYLGFTQELRRGGAIPIGNALVAAKQVYLSDTGVEVDGVFEKTILEATLFGLPMLRVQLPGPPGTAVVLPPVIGATNPVVAGPGAALDLRTADLTVTPSMTAETKILTNSVDNSQIVAHYLTGPQGAVGRPSQPILPLAAYNVSSPGGLNAGVLRGVGFRSGAYTDEPDVFPLVSAPANEVTAVRPGFQSSVFFPVVPWTVNYFGVLADPDGGETRLMLTPAQYRSGDGDLTRGVFRRFDHMAFRLYYSSVVSGTALSAPPAIAKVTGTPDAAGNVHFSASVSDPVAGVQEVWVTYAAVDGASWQSLDLVRNSTEPAQWEAVLPASAVAASNLRYIVQAVNGVGLVTLLTNNGEYFTPGIDPGAPVKPPLATDTTSATPVTLQLLSAPTAGVYGGELTYAIRLVTAQGQTVADATLEFSLQGQSIQTTTGADGAAQATFRLLGATGAGTLQVTYAGSATYAGAVTTVNVTVAKRDTRLVIEVPVSPVASGSSWRIVASLTDAGGLAIAGRPVLVTLTGAAGVYGQVVPTDYAGRAILSGVAVTPGVYQVAASFGQPVTVNAQPLDLTDPGYHSATSNATLTITPGNIAPQALDDHAEVDSVSRVIIDVAGNDTDVDGNLSPASVTVLVAPVGGAATVDGTAGKITYTGSAQFSGIDRILYQICDSGADGNPATTGDNLCSTANVVVVVLPGSNTPPQVGPIALTTHLVAVVELGESIAAQAIFTDSAETHSAVWTWGDGTTTPGTVSGNRIVGPDSHQHTMPGVYTLVLAVTDAGALTGEALYQYVVVYDPLAGVASGEGWINSPAGAYVANPGLVARAKFGFEAKYEKNATVPKGSLEFRLDKQRLESRNMDWLVIAGSKAILRGRND
ncbi:MAG: hypothetical protein IPK16_10545 [Anaerolineales bacterium]|nr:hypothetical protein [Anaerolineales bacterium]